MLGEMVAAPQRRVFPSVTREKLAAGDYLLQGRRRIRDVLGSGPSVLPMLRLSVLRSNLVGRPLCVMSLETENVVFRRTRDIVQAACTALRFEQAWARSGQNDFDA